MSYALTESNASSAEPIPNALSRAMACLLMPTFQSADPSSGLVDNDQSLLGSILKEIRNQASSQKITRGTRWSRIETGAATNLETAVVAQDHAYMMLYDAVANMAALPEGQEYAIDAETARTADRFIALMALYNVPAPKVFSHGGDAVVFTWELGDVRRYVTVGDSEISVLDAHRANKMQCSAEFSLGGDIPVESWMVLLGGKRWRAAAAT